MDLSEINILELLPQQQPFIMIDRILYIDDIKTITELTIRKNNLFFDDGRLSASGLIENIAQTCAARIGYYNKYILRKSVNIGYIGAIRNLVIERTPSEAETITTQIEVMEEVFKMTLVQAVIKSNDEILVTAEMKIALSEIDSHKTTTE
ncbi:MAG: pseudouridylate synthase [Bacteroidales bacterium]|nr:pseudouridylate synthase [Bacteroidales bacterium]